MARCARFWGREPGGLVRGSDAVLSNDLRAETRFSVPATVEENGLRRGMSVPIPERSGPRHVILAHARGEGRALTDEDARFLEAVAQVLAGALDRAATEQELRRRALEDPLTGLANRALLASQLETELRHARRLGNRVCLLALDLDRFKVVNDTLGHSVGDALLRKVAARLTGCVREEDLVARPGGDEFAIVATRTATDHAIAEVAQRVVDTVAEPFVIDGHEVFVTNSGDFIQIAEETGLIVPIGSWVLGSVCEQLARWPETIHVSANVSAVQIKPELVTEVAQLLERYRITPARLVLEITESLLLDPRTKPIVVGLRKLGVQLALDDFGTGYSSLGSLQRFPLDLLKLDRTLIDSVAEHNGAAIVRAAVELGQALGVQVIAEGIEGPAQLGALQDLGCRLGQGFLFARPLPVADAQLLVQSAWQSPGDNQEQAA